MATKSELEAKIAKAKKNSMMPEGLKKSYIAKIEAEIKALEGKAEPKAKPAPAPKKKATPKKKAAPKKKAPAPAAEEKTCDELREAWEARRAAAKNKKEKTPYASSTSAVENAVDSIAKKYKADELTKGQIEKLINTLLEEIQFLKDLLKKAK
jgi:hypothetical protein